LDYEEMCTCCVWYLHIRISCKSNYNAGGKSRINMNKLIGVKFRKTKPAGIRRIRVSDTYCSFIKNTEKEEIFYFKIIDISCPLGRFYLGTDEININDVADIMADECEGMNRKSALKYLSRAVCMESKFDYIICFRYPNKNINPDIIIKVVKPDQAMRFIHKFTALTGEIMNASLAGTGSLCGECTAYPFVTGKPNISLGCIDSRKTTGIEKDEFFIALPYNSIMREILLNE
jgi:uncharacterized protein (DUF169 family)